jgi:Tfp pilus assembly protein PilP
VYGKNIRLLKRTAQTTKEVKKEEEEQVNPRSRNGQAKKRRKERFKESAQQMGRRLSPPCLFFTTLALLIGLIFISAGRSSYSADPKVEQKKTESQKTEAVPNNVEAPPKFNVADFVYSSEGRRDPFQSLPLARLRDTKMKKTTKRGYELEELKIVGLLKTDKSKYVMMEDVQGKGITFQKGDYLNSNLWVVDVLDGNVVFGYKLKEEIKKFTVDVPRK